MKEIKHTPGPWKIESADGSDLIVITDEGLLIADLCDASCGVESVEEAEANARLIAAAPDLLGALRIAGEWLNKAKDARIDFGAAYRGVTGFEVLNRVRASILKAEGKQ